MKFPCSSARVGASAARTSSLLPVPGGFVTLRTLRASKLFTGLPLAPRSGVAPRV